MRHLRSHFSREQLQSVYLSAGLPTCNYFFAHVDSVRTSLQRSYEGPLKMMERHDRFDEIDCNGKLEVISIIHVKVARLDDNAVGKMDR